MTYQIETKDNMLVLRTTSFRADGKSVLHSGIFNRELAASLTAGAVIMLLGFFFAAYSRLKTVHFLVAVFLFAVLFAAFRIFVFAERILQTVFDREKGIITITTRSAMSRARSYPISELVDIKANRIAAQPVNADGIKFVERVALQHGTVIPGLGTTEDYYTVELLWGGDSPPDKVVIYSSKERQKAEEAVARIKGFLVES